ncbi:MAG TPA: NADPH-dependent assimilatory sulfite reductase hemoprotein subunit [Gemmataceae bacterium]|nr:NADPH-dependent assimilatory sulfite reductase hemoprotein subunit [Gemmataceae bacterium]
MSVEIRLPPAAKPSAVEGIKESSRQLRGTIALELARDTDHFVEADKQLLKFHGTYQQEDRDARKSRRKDGVGKHFMFMVRCKIPGGRITADQYLALDDLASRCGNGTLRFTSRQGIQFHGVVKSHLKETIAGINACLLSTLGACGDVERNVMACPAPHRHDAAHDQLQETATLLAAHLAPRSRAYHEIWLNGRPISETETTPHDIEPLYGKVYLPRKFKTGLALPEDNCIDIYGQDLGLLGIVEDGRIVGYNVLVGGSMGMTHGNANTFPALAKPVCYVPAGSVVMAAEAVVRLFRDHGNRSDRKRARLKYVIHDWGVEKFREVLSGYLGGAPLALPKPVEVSGYDLHHGWHDQGDGKWFYGLHVENGRVKDEGSLRLRSGLRAIVERFRPGIRLTPMQDILLSDLDEKDRPELEKLLREHGIRLSEEVSPVRRYSMACPAIPTCGLAISEAERALPGIIDELEVELKRLGLGNETISTRMTGCPNGCVRPYQSDIGLVGRSGDKYTLFVGGHVLGHRMNFALKDLLPRAEVVPTLVPVLERFKADRQDGEGFGDYCQRLGAEKLNELLPKGEEPKETHAASPKSADGESIVAPPGMALPALAVKGINGDGHHVAAPVNGHLALAEEKRPAPLPRVAAETVYAGHPGEELRDFTCRYNTDGSVRETVVYFYGEDRRAASASPGDPLRREAVYVGRVDPLRLYAARKLSDTHYVGDAGHETRDLRVEYLPDGGVAQTVVFHYDGDARAADVPSGAALRRQVTYAGRLA